MHRPLALTAARLCVAVAQAQDPIPWRTEPQDAVREAKANKRPLMVYVLSSSRDRDDDIERDQRRRRIADRRAVGHVAAHRPGPRTGLSRCIAGAAAEAHAG